MAAADGNPRRAMPTRFDRDTAVHAVDPSVAGPGVYEGRIDRGWWIVRGPNGGYVAALLLRALAAEVPAARAPRSLTVHYTAPPAEGPVRIDTRVERIGRSLTTVSGRMIQGDRLLALALGAFSIAREAMGFDHARMPTAAPPDACPPFPHGIPMHARYEYRWAVGAPPGSGGAEASCGGWIRLEEPRTVDAALVAAYTDAWPPACFSWAPERDTIGPVPTVDLTIHFRAELPLVRAAPEDWCLAVFRSRLAVGGFVEEDGEVWSRDGVLLAQSRQLAAIR
jgi:acyl-CoA thioesterase